jgi:hypothetical protein
VVQPRVDDLTALLAQLESNGDEIVKGAEAEENGTFASVMDPDGNKVELWEPRGGYLSNRGRERRKQIAGKRMLQPPGHRHR